MFFSTVFILGVITNIIAVHRDDDDSFRNVAIDKESYDLLPLNPKTNVKRQELIKIIQILNGHFEVEDEKRKQGDIVNILQYNEPSSKDGTDVDDDVIRIKQLLKLLQKNYDNHMRYRNLIEKPLKPRIYIIENPEVLEEFKHNIRSRYQLTSSDTSDLMDLTRNSREDVSNYRREALFNDQDSTENIFGDRNNNDEALFDVNRLSEHRIKIEPRARDNFKNLKPMSRFKIARDTRSGPNIDRGPINSEDIFKPTPKKKMEYVENNEKFHRKREETKERIIPMNKDFNERPRQLPVASKRQKYSKKTPEKIADDRWGGRDSFKKERVKPMEVKKQSWNPIGRTFMPFVVKKTIYEDDK